MRARITSKSDLEFGTLTRHYTFDVIDDDDTVIGSQSIQESPDAVRDRIAQIIAEYELVEATEKDVEVGEVL